MHEAEKLHWKEYVKGVAEDYGVPFVEAWELFHALGPSEAHDGFISMMEDLSESIH